MAIIASFRKRQFQLHHHDTRAWRVKGQIISLDNHFY